MSRLACLFLSLYVGISPSLSMPPSEKSELKSRTTTAWASEVHQEDDCRSVETTVAPVSRADQIFTAAVPHQSFLDLHTIQETNRTTPSVSLQEDAKHPEERNQAAVHREPNSALAIKRGEKDWEMSTWPQNMEKKTSSAPTIAGSDMVTEQGLSLPQGDATALSVMKATRSTEATSSYEEFVSSCSVAAQRLCGCSPSCTVVDNCCYDSEFVEAAIESSSQNFKRHSCYSEIHQKWNLSSPSRLINRCPQNWTNDAVRDLCEKPAGNDISSYVPCYSPDTRLSYKNIHCLHCNGLSENSLWEVTFQSSYPHPFSSINSFAKLNNSAGLAFFRNIQFVLSPQAGFEPSHCSFAIDECHSEFTTKTLSKMCRAYYSPVLIEGIMYRNGHCFQCATGTSFEGRQAEIIARQHQNPLSLLLNVTLDQDGRTCPPSGCVPQITRVRGYYEVFSVGVTFTLIANTSFLAKPVVADLNSRCVFPPILMFVNENLEQYKHKVKFHMKKSKVFEDEKEILIMLLIIDDIPVGDIPVINQKILSINFESSVDSLVNASCCHNTHVVNSPPKGRPTTDEIERNPSCPEMTRKTSVNNIVSAIGVNSAHKQRDMTLVISIAWLWPILAPHVSMFTARGVAPYKL